MLTSISEANPTQGSEKSLLEINFCYWFEFRAVIKYTLVYKKSLHLFHSVPKSLLNKSKNVGIVTRALFSVFSLKHNTH